MTGNNKNSKKISLGFIFQNVLNIVRFYNWDILYFNIFGVMWCYDKE